jgi:Rrf2 family iron-sulfur cluster assembly transcriptional regulator
MLSFSKTTGYAILALGCIGSWKGQRVLSGQIHDCTGIPVPYLRKTLYALGRFGLIQGKRGYQGGFVLTRPPEEITLLDVVRAVEHDKSAADCVLGLPGCSDATPCPLRRSWQKIWAQIEAELRRITVAQAAAAVRAARGGRLTTCHAPEITKLRQTLPEKLGRRKIIAQTGRRPYPDYSRRVGHGRATC